MTKYVVTARMCTVLTATIEAETPEEAIEIAKHMADNGEMIEQDEGGCIDYFSASASKE